MTAREVIASAVFAETFGGTSDPALEAMAETIATSTADAILAALREAGMVVVKTDLVSSVCDDLEAYTRQEWAGADGINPHPANRAKFDRDMEDILAIRAMLAAVEQGDAD